MNSEAVVMAADAVEAGDEKRALALLEPMSDERHRFGTCDERLGRMFAKALLIRLRGDDAGSGNPYLAASEVGPGEMIAAFDVLVSATPFVRFGYAAANEAILAAAAATDALHVVDFGIGMGTQWVEFLRALGTAQHRPRIQLTGVDLPAPGPDGTIRLSEVGERLHSEADAAGVSFSYVPLAMAMEDVDLDDVAGQNPATLAYNFAFALHHVSTTDGMGGSPRDQFLALVRRTSPTVVALVEPDSEHDALVFADRVREALRHYGAVFAALDVLVPAEHLARVVLEEEFFGKEIVNVIGFESTDRIERHERHGAWRERMVRCGFRAYEVLGAADAVLGTCHISPPAAVVTDQQMLVLEWDGTPLVAASSWTSA